MSIRLNSRSMEGQIHSTTFGEVTETTTHLFYVYNRIFKALDTGKIVVGVCSGHPESFSCYRPSYFIKEKLYSLGIRSNPYE